MNVYTVIQEFSAPTLNTRLHVGDTVDKIISRGTILIGSNESSNKAFYQWVGSVDSIPYMLFTEVIPDPPVAGVYTGVGGSQTIGSGVDSLEVSGVNFGFIPTSIVATVIKPDGLASNIFGTVREDSISQYGFTVDFSLPIPDTGYYLAYYAAPLSGQGGPPVSDFQGGTTPIPNGVTEVTIVQAFGFLPSMVVVSVTKPDGAGSNIFATVKQDSITETGFIVDLSATTTSLGYVLNYFVKS